MIFGVRRGGTKPRSTTKDRADDPGRTPAL
jgi:hypothetical protein